MALRWLIDHQRKEGVWASWALLASGVSLGLTALINGPLAVAVVAVAGGATGARLATVGRERLSQGRTDEHDGCPSLGRGNDPVPGRWSRTDWWRPFRGKAMPLAGSFCLWCLTGFAVAGWWW